MTLGVVREQLAEATAAKKCHGCGCLHKAVEALSATLVGRGELSETLRDARAVFEPKRYDCLGCATCYPALAANAFAEVFPEGAALDLCPTDAPAERPGWPPLPGDFEVVRYGGTVAVCTLHSADLSRRLAARAPDGLAIVGTMQTENLGIERLIRNVLANPHIRHLVVCGEDTRQAVGHLPGQSLACLCARGLDERGRIQGAQGKRPILKNVSRAQVEAFRRQVELRSLIGVTDDEVVVRAIADCARLGTVPFADAEPDAAKVGTIEAVEPRRLVADPAGFVVVYPDVRRGMLVAEHYTNAGVLDCVIEGRTPAAVYAEVIARSLISRLDHAAYLGRELARAEHSLATGEPYVQDRAAGDCGCPGACGGAQ